MLANQHLLPRYEVPELLESIRLFLKSVHPLLTVEEFDETEKVADNFVNGSTSCSEKAQNYLKKKAECSSNWLADWWIENAYLKYRSPLILFSSPAYFLPRQAIANEDDHFRLAASAISAALKYRQLIVENALEPEVVGKGRRLCMSQYPLIFDNCRIPGKTMDEMVTRTQQIVGNHKPIHVVVIYHNRFFKLSNFEKSKDHQKPDAIMATLLQTLKKDKYQSDAIPLGILTSWQRDKWFEAHGMLEKYSKQNKKTLETIRTSAFVVCLDTNSEAGNVDPMVESLNQVLHGSGGTVNSGNRWFDKTIQLIIGNNGVWGICLEHSISESIPHIALADYIADQVLNGEEQWKELTTKRQTLQNSLEPLKFKINQDLERSIVMASFDSDKLIADLDTDVLIFDKWGRDDCAKLSVSADGLCQLSIQLAYFKIHKEAANCYETASLRRFLDGRTDTIRACSDESLALCHFCSFSNSEKTPKQELLAKALKCHHEFVVRAVSGKGFDRHLLGLKLAYQEMGLDLDPFFTSPGYVKALRFVVATSQVGSCFDDAAMGYGPAVPVGDGFGYGCCYNIRPNRIIFGISSWKSCKDTDSHAFANALNESMTELYDIAVSNSTMS